MREWEEKRMRRPPQVPLFRGKDIIKQLGDLCIAFLLKMPNSDYESEDGCLTYASCGGNFECGDVEITCNYFFKRGYEEVEVVVYRDEGGIFLGNVSVAVQEYVTRNIDFGNFRKTFQGMVDEDEMDDYERNGFASEADYMTWRYG